MTILVAITILILYYILGALINGIMHRFDPYWFSNDSFSVGLVVQAWIIIIPVYFLCLLCDRCIILFEKKGKNKL